MTCRAFRGFLRLDSVSRILHPLFLPDSEQVVSPQNWPPGKAESQERSANPWGNNGLATRQAGVRRPTGPTGPGEMGGPGSRRPRLSQLVNTSCVPVSTPLDDLVFQRCDSQWSLLTIWFGNPAAFGRLRSVRAALDSPLQIIDPPLDIHAVLSPSHSINARRGMFLQVEEARFEQFGRDMVQQIVEPHRPITSCRLSYAQQSARPGRPALCPVQSRLLIVLLGQLPSLHKLRGRRHAVVVRLLPRYYEAV